MLNAIKEAVFQALGTYGLLAFVASLPSPVGFPLPIWTLPSLILALMIYNIAYRNSSSG
ncbi:hypothetical protein KL86PLE_100343 [uncultured Pleomorphomonas sp.]|uniref:Uncharacterized protein n=1 Tax=uncultured Pleomorphomonas sp. TaxID=442121 RepID=A0A212L364_9HYPH|nr:hypothetical protein [uncultured Pleomorphomonas sp.]SCM71799.1 hypothetical protein KL86PLE_100343 [uncultured Pleomorphomonas sp.]